MPKRRKSKISTVITRGTEEGEVWVSVGVKFSANYSSRDFTIGVRSPILDGEDDLVALTRVETRVITFFQARAEDNLDILGNVIDNAKNRS